MPQPIYLPQQENPWEKFLPMIMQLGMMKMKSNLDLANAKELQAEKYKNFEAEQIGKVSTDLTVEAGKRALKTQDIVGSLNEVPSGADTSKFTNVTKINGKDYFLPHGTRYDAGTQSLENLPEAKGNLKPEVRYYTDPTTGKLMAQEYNFDATTGTRANAGDAYLSDKTKAWQPTSKEEAIEVQKSGKGYVPQDEAAALRLRRAGKTDINIGGGLGKTTQNKIETDIIDADTKIQSFNEMEKLFKPEYLTYIGEAKAGYQKYAEKTGISTDTKFLKEKTAWKQQSMSSFLEWRKWITGVAGGEKEMKEIAKSFPDPERNSPTEYKSNLVQARKWTTKAKNRLVILRSLGIDKPSKEQLGQFPLSDIPEILPKTTGGSQQSRNSLEQISNDELISILRGQ